MRKKLLLTFATLSLLLIGKRDQEDRNASLPRRKDRF